MSATRVAVVSEDRLFRDTLEDILRGDPAFTTIPWEHPPADDIDIALVDARSPDALRDVPPLRGTRPILVFVGAGDDDDDWAAGALGMGARGILTLTASRGDLVKALAVVRDGGIWAKRRWLNACLQRAQGGAQPPMTALLAARRLSRREAEVFRQAATGVPNKELADRLSISEATVKVHLTRIFRKLGVSGRAELAAVYYGLRPAAGALGHTERFTA